MEERPLREKLVDVYIYVYVYVEMSDRSKQQIY